VATSYTRNGGYVGAKQLLERRPRPTAIFAGADFVAMGVLDAVAEAGLKVPDDISVAGYDNTTFAAFSPISLTSVDQAGAQMGRDTARLLLERIADRAKRSVQVRLSPTLIVIFVVSGAIGLAGVALCARPTGESSEETE